MYTPQQIQNILKNPHVEKCSDTTITYAKAFKAQAVKSYYEDGLSPSMIFKEAGFDLHAIGHTTPQECLRRWKKIYHTQGKEGLLIEGRGLKGKGGRPPEIKTTAEKIKFLEAKVTYLDAENDFLAKLRGIKRRKFSDHPKSSRS